MFNRRKQDWSTDNLNTAIVFLTGLAVYSTLQDIYEFLHDERDELHGMGVRPEFLGGIALLLLLILAFANWRVTHHGRHGPRGR